MIERTPTINDALFALGISGGWKIKEGKIVKWWAEKEQPSDEAIQSKLSELQAEYDSKSYARNRQQNFPNEHDLLIALWEKVMEDRSESADALQAIRTQVKSDNPKP
jgi:hypothetical protein